jgi:hypothetical protein
MKNKFVGKLKIMALSLLIVAMLLFMHNENADYKYWIALVISIISIIVINLEFFKKNNKE